MISCDERREVAARLRGLEVFQLDGEFVDCGEVDGALGLVSDDGAWYEAAGVMRLADLIEPGDEPNGELPERLRTFADNDERSGCDRAALLALANEMDRSATELLKTNELDSNRKRRSMRMEHARDLMVVSSRIREALGCPVGGFDSDGEGA